MSAKTVIAAALLAWGAGAAYASGATDLLQAWQLAQTADPVLAAARHSLQMAEQRVPQARAALLPTVNFNAGGNRQSGTASFDGGPEVQRDPHARNWSVQLVQPLYKPQHWAGLQQADAQWRQAVQQYRLAQQDAILRLAQAYFDVLVAQEGAAVAHAQGAAMAQQLRLAQRNFEVGMTTVTDVHEAQSRFQLARAQQAMARSELEHKRAELQRILGESPPQLAGLRPGAVLPAPVDAGAQGADHWMLLAQRDHPEVLLQQAAVEAADFELERQRAGHAPSLELTASRNGSFNAGSLSTPADTRIRNQSGQVGVQLTVPLYAGGATTARGGRSGLGRLPAPELDRPLDEAGHGLAIARQLVQEHQDLVHQLQRRDVEPPRDGDDALAREAELVLDDEAALALVVDVLVVEIDDGRPDLGDFR